MIQTERGRLVRLENKKIILPVQMFTLFVHTLCSMNFSEMYYDGETFMMLTHEYKYQHFFIKRVRLVYL